MAPVQTTGLNNTDSIDIPYSSRLKKIISVGSINIDTYLNFKELSRPGKTMITPSSIIHPGGKCINEAIGVAKIATYAAGLSTTRQGTSTALVDRYTLEAYIRRAEPGLLK